jgi:hypothetical protein
VFGLGERTILVGIQTVELLRPDLLRLSQIVGAGLGEPVRLGIEKLVFRHAAVFVGVEGPEVVLPDLQELDVRDLPVPVAVEALEDHKQGLLFRREIVRLRRHQRRRDERGNQAGEPEHHPCWPKPARHSCLPNDVVSGTMPLS